MKTTSKAVRWRWGLLLGVAAMALLFLLFAGARETPWRVRANLGNWRIHASDAAHFDPDGRQISSTKAYHFGPVTVWRDVQALPLVTSTNPPGGASSRAP
jgi:hypothetical protein